MDRRRTNHLPGLSCNIISITIDMLTGHCVLERHAGRMQLPLNGFCHECRSAEEEETVVHFLWQCPSLAICRYRVSGFLDETIIHLCPGYMFVYQTVRLVIQRSRVLNLQFAILIWFSGFKKPSQIIFYTNRQAITFAPLFTTLEKNRKKKQRQQINTNTNETITMWGKLKTTMPTIIIKQVCRQKKKKKLKKKTHRKAKTKLDKQNFIR